MITAQQLYRCVGELSSADADRWIDAINETFSVFEINTDQRAADFLAQTGHESLGFKLLREVWGPNQVPAQQTYERDPAKPWGPTLKRGDRNFKAYNLGNAQPGDGFLFRGRGLIQTTGRTNYAKARDELRALNVADVPDFEADPDSLMVQRWAALSGGLFWKRNGLNALSDRMDFVGMTERINGGQNGLAGRQARRIKARKALGLA